MGRADHRSKPPIKVRRKRATSRLYRTEGQARKSSASNTIRFLPPPPSTGRSRKRSRAIPARRWGWRTWPFVLWTEFLHHDPRSPHWTNRDRFVLSAGPRLDAALFASPSHRPSRHDDGRVCRHFRQWGSKTAGHPEYGQRDGHSKESDDPGPLGQGIAHAVGDGARREEMLAARLHHR